MSFTDLTGSKNFGGQIRTDKRLASADTWLEGMLASLQESITADATGNTGNGTCTDVVARKKAWVGTWKVHAVSALVFDLIDPNDDVVVEGINLPDGGAITINNDYFDFTLTDGGTDFIAGDEFDLVVTGAGAYTEDIERPEVICCEDKVLASEGYVLFVVDGGSWKASELVEGDTTAITVTEQLRAYLNANGIKLA